MSRADNRSGGVSLSEHSASLEIAGEDYTPAWYRPEPLHETHVYHRFVIEIDQSERYKFHDGVVSKELPSLFSHGSDILSGVAFAVRAGESENGDVLLKFDWRPDAKRVFEKVVEDAGLGRDPIPLSRPLI